MCLDCIAVRRSRRFVRVRMSGRVWAEEFSQVQGSSTANDDATFELFQAPSLLNMPKTCCLRASSLPF